MADNLRNRDFDKSLHAFWSGFGINAYHEDTVPDTAMKDSGGHYITYNSVAAGPFEPRPLTANIWYRDPSWAAIDAKRQEIYDAIGLGGVLVPFNRGNIWIVRNPQSFAQRLPDDDDTIRRIYIQVMAEDHTSY